MIKVLYKNKITKQVASIFGNKVVLWIITPIFLLIFWVFLSYQYIASKTGVSVLTYSAKTSDHISLKTKELLKGEKIEGQFVADDNHLGIIAVRFETYSRINKDSVTFRIKEKGSKNWLYEHSYLVDQFQDDKYFTFGMPIVDNSFGRIYQFEIESMCGKSKDAIALSKIEPFYVTKYKFPKKEIIKDKDIFVKFIFMKTTESLSDGDFIASSTIYLLPFLFYIALVIVFLSTRYFLKDDGLNKLLIHLPLYPILVSALITVIFAKTIYPLMIAIVIVLWMIVIIRYDFKSRVTFVFGSACLLVSPFLLLFSFVRQAVNISIWAYVFLVIATIQALIELKLTRNSDEKA
jgi:hypothetical protein